MGATFGCCLLCVCVVFLSCWCCPKLRKYRDVLERQIASRENALRAQKEELESLAAEEAELEADERAFEMELVERAAAVAALARSKRLGSNSDKHVSFEQPPQQQPAASAPLKIVASGVQAQPQDRLSRWLPALKWADYYMGKPEPVPTIRTKIYR